MTTTPAPAPDALPKETKDALALIRSIFWQSAFTGPQRQQVDAAVAHLESEAFALADYRKPKTEEGSRAPAP